MINYLRERRSGSKIFAGMALYHIPARLHSLIHTNRRLQQGASSFRIPT